MNIFTQKLSELSQIKKTIKAVKKGEPAALYGLTGIAKSNVILSFLDEFNQILVLTKNQKDAFFYCNNLNQMSGSVVAAVFLEKDLVFDDNITVSKDSEISRLTVLSDILSRKIKIVFCSCHAARSLTCPPDVVRKSTVTFKKQATFKRDGLIETITDFGYSKTDLVESAGQFCVRGSIIDIFPPNFDNPVRLDFFGDTLEKIETFSPNTQKRLDGQNSVDVIQASEFFISRAKLLNKLKNLTKKDREQINKEVVLKDIETLSSGVQSVGLDKYIPAVYDSPFSILDYFKDALLVADEYSSAAKTDDEADPLGGFGGLNPSQIPFPLKDYCVSPKTISGLLKAQGLFLNTFDCKIPGVAFKEKHSVMSAAPPGFESKIKPLSDSLKDYIQKDYTAVVVGGTPKSSDSLTFDLNSYSVAAVLNNQNRLVQNKVNVVPGFLDEGVEYPEAKFVILSKAKFQDYSKRVKNYKKGEDVRSLSDLSLGDLVVHLVYGVGRFDGVTKLKTQGIFKDYIKIKYAKGDVLYVSVSQLDMISKYIGAPSEKVKLCRLGTDDWKRAKGKVKKAVEKMARDLIKLYAQRENTKGFAFSEDNDWMKSFESHFEYEETDDQLRAVAEIKKDMQSGRPMDRLLCGDVGFGKTEVAFRAAFKCALDGKQTVILCPTTILAWQHYATLIRRLGDFPLNVELLLRFKTKKEQEQAIEKLKSNQADIVIGTHRLIQNDVEFYNLGLAIIDEEQRFGVMQKEKFKKLFAGIDVLTLSATPIPRTLNMAMSGLRDISVLEHPPLNRHTVRTYVLEYQNDIIQSAISNELKRNGQVYYIHNRIETIYEAAHRVRQMAPDAKIGIAHGRMNEKTLSETWARLLNHDIDILVSTTIVESGVDVKNVNTLIVENSELLGLSQLYQLRGRVGRSDRRAFAYFTFFKGYRLNDTAVKRLNAIKEFTRFGSGFKIALRDLEIRGAGNLLGESQHGQMEAVGYDMYLRILSKEVKRLQGKQVDDSPKNCVVELPVEANIPDDYIPSLDIKLDIYKKISAIGTKRQERELKLELTDRFGQIPKPVRNLIEIAKLRRLAIQKGYTEINLNDDYLRFYPQTIDNSLINKIKTDLGRKVYAYSTPKTFFDVELKNDPPLTFAFKILNM